MSPPCDNATFSPTTETQIAPNILLDGLLGQLVKHADTENLLGPIDSSCSFVVADGKQPGFPIVYTSPGFTQLTGYEPEECFGRSCRFLQRPDGDARRRSTIRFTDKIAVKHIRRLLRRKRPCQARLINYKKGGRSFINLVTVIPICDDRANTMHYYGFQVDLAERPDAILRATSNGTYNVDYTVSNLPHPVSSISSRNLEASTVATTATPMVHSTNINTFQRLSALLTKASPDGQLDRKVELSHLALNNAHDLIYILSLKGEIVYASPSARSILEFSMEELLGKPFASICHPSDSQSVLRQLKAGSPSCSKATFAPVLNILCRVRTKRDGYIWLDSVGRMLNDNRKGRKLLLFTGRSRMMPFLSWHSFQASGGLDTVSVWAKVSVDGIFLWAATSISKIFGEHASKVVGKTLFDFIPGGEIPGLIDDRTAMQAALRKAARSGTCPGLDLVRHRIRNMEGSIREVVTHVFPLNATKGSHRSFPDVHPFGHPNFDEANQAGYPQSGFWLRINLEQPDSPDSTRSGTQTLEMTHSGNANLFVELEPLRSTSWEYEIFHLQSENRRLKERIRAISAHHSAAPLDGMMSDWPTDSQYMTRLDADHPVSSHQRTPAFGLVAELI